MVISQVRQVHVAGVVHASDLSAGCDRHISRVVDRQDDVIARMS
jgi:hypothetical protein